MLSGPDSGPELERRSVHVGGPWSALYSAPDEARDVGEQRETGNAVCSQAWQRRTPSVRMQDRRLEKYENTFWGSGRLVPPLGR
eukprot:COSAG02_NODE_23404_length_719_cov_63.822581_2_plen_83_part_01